MFSRVKIFVLAVNNLRRFCILRENQIIFAVCQRPALKIEWCGSSNTKTTVKKNLHFLSAEAFAFPVFKPLVISSLREKNGEHDVLQLCIVLKT